MPPAASAWKKPTAPARIASCWAKAVCSTKSRTPPSRLAVVPSEVDLCAADIELVRMENHLLRLAGALQPVLEAQLFDLVLVDCPPSLGILTLNAFAASDGLLVPLQCEYYSLEGISMMNRVLGQLRNAGVNPRLEIFGVVMTMFDGRTKLSNEVVTEVRNQLGARVFETLIPRSTRLAEAPSFGKPIIHYDKYSSGAAAYELLAQEVLKRLEIDMLKRTPLFAAHQKLGGKLIEFGGWEMPVQYTSITDEHLAVRNAAGILDISHMGEVTVSGSGAAAFLNSVLTNDIRKLVPGEGQYTLMGNECGGVVDDLYAYQLSDGVYFLIINASRIAPDVAWLRRRLRNFPANSS